MKNAHIYRAQLPSIADISDMLAQIPARDPEPTMVASHGFCPHPVTGELATPVGDGSFAFCLLTCEKVLPRAAVKLAAAKRQAEFEADMGRPVTRREREDVIANVVADMLPAAFVQQKMTICYYSHRQQILIVDTASKTSAMVAISLLLRAAGSIKTTTIHIDGIKQGLASKLRDSLADQRDSIGPFRAGGELQLSGLDGEIVRYKGIDPVCHEELLSHLSHGYKIEKIALANDAIRFNLHADFRISGISIERDEDEEMDAAAAWRAQAGAALVLLCDAVNAICDLFHAPSADEPAAKAAQPAATGDAPTKDPLYAAAVAFVRESGRASISAVQRHLRLSYNRAAQLLDAMEQQGVVTVAGFNGHRDVVRE